MLSTVLDRRVRYARPGLPRYLRHATRTLRMPPGMAAVTAAIYTTARLGLADGLSDDVQRVLGEPPASFAEFARREQPLWSRRGG